MKPTFKLLPTLVCLLAALILAGPAAAVVTFKWFTDTTFTPTVDDNMAMEVQARSPNAFNWTTLRALKVYFNDDVEVIGVTNIYVMNSYVITNHTDVSYTTNLYVATNYVDYSYITNLYVLTNNVDNYTTNLYTTNLYVYNYGDIKNLHIKTNYTEYAYITNLYVDITYITNLYVDNFTVTNLYVTNLFAGDLEATNLWVYSNAYINYLTVTNGITNLSLSPDCIVKTDSNRELVSLLNGLGLLTNSGSGTFGWMPLDQLTNFNTLEVLSNAYFFSTNYFNTISTTNLIVQSNAYFFATNFFNTITVTNPITNLSLTANTIVKADANSALASIANGSGVLTNNGSGTFGWLATSLLTVTNPPDSYFTNLYATNIFASNIVATTIVASNAFFTNLWASNAYIRNLYATNIFTQQIKYYTNQGTMAPDFSLGYDGITTNADFTFLLPINYESNGKFVETTVKKVVNTKGSPILASLPANIHAVPGSVWYITNATRFTFVLDGSEETNCYAVPIR